MRRARSVAIALALIAPVVPVALRAQVPDPILVRGRDADVLVYAPAARDSAADAARLAGLVPGCRVGLDISSADSARLVDAPAPPFPLDVWQVRDAIVLAVLPSAVRLVDCDDPRTQAALAPVRGLRVTLDTAYSPSRDIARVVVRQGTRELQPLIVEQHGVRRLGAGGFLAPREHWLRLAFDRTAFAPGASGVHDDLTVEVQFVSQGPPERIALPWVAVRVAWESSLRARQVLGATVAPPVALERPRDARLAAMHDAYAAGEQERAVQLAAPHLSGAARADASSVARTHAALALLALGDTASARVVTAALVAQEPCLRADAAAPAAVRELLDGPRRSPARCAAQPPRRTLLRAAFLPGFARPADGSRGVGRRVDERLLVFAASVGITAAAVQKRSIALARYDDYLAVQARPLAPDEVDLRVQGYFDDAERARHASITLGTIGALIWVGQGLYALRAERRLGERLARVQRIGAPARGTARATLAPQVRPGSVGLSLSLEW